MTEDVDRLKAEVAAEGAEDVYTDQVITTLRTDVDELRSALAEVQPALEAAQSGEAEAKQELESVLQAVREAADQLAADNPRDDSGAHPDNSLPTGGDANTGGDHIDNSLPGSQPHPDIEGPGDQPVINPLGGQRGQRGK